MKTKLLIFLGLVIGSASLAIAFNTPPAHAIGEKYVWTSATTIQASGGQYKGTTTFTVSNEQRISGSTMELTTNNININTQYGACSNTVGRLSLHSNSKTAASLWLGDTANGSPTSCGTYPAREHNMDAEVSVAAQPVPAINYNTVNCGQISTSPDGLAQCKAIQACVVTANKPQAECIAAMGTCISNHSADGAITEAAKADCIKKVTAGDTPGATAPVKTDEKKTTCAVAGVGWIICPVLTFMALIVDASYGFVASLLFVQPLVISGGTGPAAEASQGIYKAWTVMRNFANISFVMAFLFIIFSQLTSIGITNYGIKKMLPKIIVSAILVNISFWICAAAVDLSNIAGSSINGILQGVKDGALAIPSEGLSGKTTGDGWEGIVGGVLAGTIAAGLALYATLSALLPALIAVIVTILVVFLVLTLRQALIILLIVISPLAFVAYLLPNTENLFKKWKDLFQVLLIMYPLISLVFGASALASTVVMGSATGTYKVAIQIMGAAIAVLPLIVVPTMIKTATGVLGKFGAFVDNPNKGPISALKRGAEGYRDKRQDIAKARRIGGTNMFREGQARIRGDGSNRARRIVARTIGGVITPTSAAASGLAVRGVNKELQAANAKKALADAKQDYVVDRVSEEARNNENNYARKIAGPTGDVNRITSQAVAASRNETAEAIKNAQVSADIPPGRIDLIGERLAEAIRNDDDVTARAMQNMLLTKGSAGIDEYRSTMTHMEGEIDYDNGAGSALRENILDNHSNIKAAANDLIQQAVQGAPMSSVSNNANTWVLPDAELVQQKPSSIHLAIDTGAVSKEQATRILGNKELEKHLDPAVRARIEAI